jgi:bifunctional UDP-N-acetylglucosamine pyrophosphorylase/glucosamine-1-phosphate N-acetyltransferase
MDDATGYGRIIRNNDGDVIAIVEHRDANDDQRQILEVNTGIYVFRGDVLDSALRQISNDNAQSEYYLTDVIDILVKSGKRVGCVQAPADETAGVNDPDQLAFAESVLRDRAETALRSRAETALRARAEKGG